MNSSGKVLTIFLVIIAILLISLTAISLFFFQKETERRKLTEVTLEEFRTENTKLGGDLKKIKKENFLLQEKKKEADERVNDLSDELELEKGLREEMKIETSALKEQAEAAMASKETLVEEIRAKEELQEKLTADLSALEQKIKELEAQLKAEKERGQELGQFYEQQQEKTSRLEEARMTQETVSEKMTAGAPSRMDGVSDKEAAGRVLSLGIELEEIVVVPGDAEAEDVISVETILLGEKVPTLSEVLDGRILSVDRETEFVIVSLGTEDGVAVGNILSVYRDEDYVGDIKITRLQPEMSAADLIPPFSIREVKKNDQVKAK